MRMYDFENDQEQAEETKQKRRKEKKQAEILDTPRRYLVRSIHNSVIHTETKPPGSALMGTHEDQRHAEKRLGW